MKFLLIKIIELYQFFSQYTPASCRFYPTCSAYVKTAIVNHGLWDGILLGIKRIFKCHPYHPGGYDPIPKKN